MALYYIHTLRDSIRWFPYRAHEVFRRMSSQFPQIVGGPTQGAIPLYTSRVPTQIWRALPMSDVSRDSVENWIQV